MPYSVSEGSNSRAFIALIAVICGSSGASILAVYKHNTLRVVCEKFIYKIFNELEYNFYKFLSMSQFI